MIDLESHDVRVLAAGRCVDGLRMQVGGFDVLKANVRVNDDHADEGAVYQRAQRAGCEGRYSNGDERCGEEPARMQSLSASHPEMSTVSLFPCMPTSRTSSDSCHGSALGQELSLRRSRCL